LPDSVDGLKRKWARFDPARTRRALLRDRSFDPTLELLAGCCRAGCELLICDKGYAGREFAAAVAETGATVVRPARPGFLCRVAWAVLHAAQRRPNGGLHAQTTVA
jgi:transposase